MTSAGEASTQQSGRCHAEHDAALGAGRAFPIRV